MGNSGKSARITTRALASDSSQSFSRSILVYYLHESSICGKTESSPPEMPCRVACIVTSRNAAASVPFPRHFTLYNPWRLRAAPSRNFIQSSKRSGGVITTLEVDSLRLVREYPLDSWRDQRLRNNDGMRCGMFRSRHRKIPFVNFPWKIPPATESTNARSPRREMSPTGATLSNESMVFVRKTQLSV